LNGATKEYSSNIYSSMSLRDQIVAKLTFSASEMEKTYLKMKTQRQEMKSKNILIVVTYANKMLVGEYMVSIFIVIILQWKDYQYIYQMRIIFFTT